MTRTAALEALQLCNKPGILFQTANGMQWALDASPAWEEVMHRGTFGGTRVIDRITIRMFDRDNRAEVVYRCGHGSGWVRLAKVEPGLLCPSCR